ncbi:MAG: 3,5-cyclic-AMP phosphodiesterase [Acidimicrobiaceae bacterium]
MPCCCHLTRRQLLQWAAVVAATPLLSALDDSARAYGMTRAASAGPMLPVNLELVTLTETSAILTWFSGDPTRVDSFGRLAPVPADTEVLLGTAQAGLHQAFFDATPTPYHYVELNGLEPGQTYFYVAQSGGMPATSSANAFGNGVGSSTLDVASSGPFTFTTPQPPPGEFLFAIALCNDLHFGETVAGLVTSQGGGIPPGIQQVPGEPPYPEVMTAALGVEARQRGADLLAVSGDVTAEAAQKDVTVAKTFLDAFGPYGESYVVTRGNHDRPHAGDAAGACSAVSGHDGLHDCFRDAFFPRGPTWFSTEANGLRVIGLDTYDKIGNGGDNGVLSEEQFSFLGDELASSKDQPTLVLGHHPVTLEASVTTAEPLIFDMDQQQAVRLESLYAASPGVFLHHSGHTHRNKRTLSPTATNVVFQEVAAVKEYPGGFHLLRVFSGGYALNYYKFRDLLAQEWSERSRQEYGGLAPFYVFGNVADRNSVVVRDFSGLQTNTGTGFGPGGGGGGETLPATGADSEAILAGAALAAAVAAGTWLREAKSRTTT